VTEQPPHDNQEVPDEAPVANLAPEGEGRGRVADRDPLVRKVRRNAEAIAQAILGRVRPRADAGRGTPDSASPARRLKLPAMRDTGSRAGRALRRTLTH
jgi:hypothetical protein